MRVWQRTVFVAHYAQKQAVKLFVSPRRQLQMTGDDPTVADVLRHVNSKLENFCRQLLENCRERRVRSSMRSSLSYLKTA